VSGILTLMIKASSVDRTTFQSHSQRVTPNYFLKNTWLAQVSITLRGNHRSKRLCGL